MEIIEKVINDTVILTDYNHHNNISEHLARLLLEEIHPEQWIKCKSSVIQKSPNYHLEKHYPVFATFDLSIIGENSKDRLGVLEIKHRNNNNSSSHKFISEEITLLYDSVSLKIDLTNFRSKIRDLALSKRYIK